MEIKVLNFGEKHIKNKFHTHEGSIGINEVGIKK